MIHLIHFYKGKYKIFAKQNFILLRTRTTNTKKTKFKKIAWFIFIIFIPFIYIGSILIPILFSNKNSKSYLIPNENVAKYLKLSKNKQNVLFLYFDRTQGVTWNLLLLVDEIINKENAFIKLFPEFTSYANVLSNGSLTKISNPAIYSGPMFNIAMKQSISKNVDIQPKTNNKLNENEWYFYALYNLSKMLIDNDVSNITYNNLPYYGDTSMSSQYCFGNMRKLQDDFSSINMDINTMTNAKIANYKFNRYIKLLEQDSIYDAEVLNKLPSIIKFDSSNSGTFFSFFSQQTHENYIIKEKNKYKSSNSKEDFVRSIWTVMQDLKPFLLRLKNEPFVDNDGNIIYDKNGKPITVYDKSLIFVLSDHGYEVRSLNIFKNICKYLLNHKKITKQQYDTIFNFNWHHYIPCLNIKPFKYDIQDHIINKQDKFVFNDDQVLSLQDIPIIMENYLNQYLNSKQSSHFVSDDIINSFMPTSYRDLIQAQSLPDPLDENKNSLKKRNLEHRIFATISTYNWKMIFDSNSFEINSMGIWKVDPNKGFYNNDNMEKIWSRK